MKINFQGLKPHLTSQSKSFYLVFGDEPYQKEKSLEIIKQYFQTEQNFNDIERQTFDKMLDSEWFYQVSDNLSLFGDKTLIIIRFNQIPDEKSKKILAEFAQSEHSDTVLILLLPQLNSQQQKQKWFKSIEALGVVLPIWSLNRLQMQKLIHQLSTEKKITLTNQACEKLIDLTEGNILATVQTLEKLSITHANNEVTDYDISEVISTASHYDVFALSEAFLKHDFKRVVLVINQLKHSGCELVLLLWAVSQDIRLLLQFKQAQNAMMLNNLFQKHRIWKSRQFLYQQALKQYSTEALKNKLSQCHQVDQLLKSYQTETAWQKLAEVVLF